jgi:nitrogenase iron protein NifH
MIFRELAHKVMENDLKVVPTPINELPELEEMYRRYLVKK